MAGTPPEDNDVVSVAFLRNEINHLKEYLALKFGGLEGKVDVVERKVDGVNGTVREHDATIQKHDDHLGRIQKVLDGVMYTILKWTAAGFGVAIAIIVIIAGIARAMGIW